MIFSLSRSALCNTISNRVESRLSFINHAYITWVENPCMNSTGLVISLCSSFPEFMQDLRALLHVIYHPEKQVQVLKMLNYLCRL